MEGCVLGGRSDWGTDPRPAVEIDEEAEGDYAVGDESGVQRGGGSHRRPGPRPAVHIDEDLFRSHCTRAGPDKLTDSQLSLVFGCTLARVKRLKVLLGLNGLGKVHDIIKSNSPVLVGTGVKSCIGIPRRTSLVHYSGSS